MPVDPLDIHKLILTAAQARITVLGLKDQNNVSLTVYRKLLLNEAYIANLTFPCVVVAGQGDEQTTGHDLLVGGDGTEFPLLCRILDRDILNDTTREDLVYHWRAQIRTGLRNQRISTGLDTWLVKWQGGEVIEQIDAALLLFSSSLTFRVRATEPRVTT